MKQLQLFFILSLITIGLLSQASSLKKAGGEFIRPLPQELDLEEGDVVTNDSKSPVKMNIQGTEVTIEPQSSFSVSQRTEGDRESLVLKIDKGEVSTQKLSAPVFGQPSLVVASDLGEIKINEKPGQQIAFSVDASNNTTSVRVFSGPTDLKVNGSERINLNSGGQVLLTPESSIRTPAAPQAQIILGSPQPTYISAPSVRTSLPQMGSSQLNFESGYRLPPQMSIQTPVPRIQIPSLPPTAGKGRVRARISMD